MKTYIIIALGLIMAFMLGRIYQSYYLAEGIETLLNKYKKLKVERDNLILQVNNLTEINQKQEKIINKYHGRDKK